MLNQIRFILAETFISWALRIIPSGPEARELAIFITQSWISKVGGQRVSTNRPTQEELQKGWQDKLVEYKK